jgi:pyridoxamine 5'-phosphate oxidase
MSADPLARFHRWHRAAERAGVPLHDAMALATADRRGVPSVRYVLLKQADARGFVFFTDGRSRKGGELGANPRAAAAFYWDGINRQVRIEGRVVPVSAAEADAYWETRPRASRLAACASLQTATLRRRADIVARWEALRRRYAGGPVPRPATWVGFRIVPRSIEFWSRRAGRLHHREVFERRRGRWRGRLLQP